MLRGLFEKYKQVFGRLVEMIICHTFILIYETLGCNIELVPEEDREEVQNVLDGVAHDKVSANFVKQRETWIDNLVKIKTLLEHYIRPMDCLASG